MAKIAAWRRQHAALQAPAYRVTLLAREGSKAGISIVPGKSKVPGQPERLYAADEVEAMIPTLRWRNATGFDVFLTPIDPAHHYCVLDDLHGPDEAVLAKVRELGLEPCLVQRTSGDSAQVVCKAPRLQRGDEIDLANAHVQALNRRHGDPHFSGAVHAFRMAGFSNRKPGRGSAFCRILEAAARLCSYTVAQLQRLRADADARAAQRRGQAAQAVPASQGLGRGLGSVTRPTGDPAEAFVRAAESSRAWVRQRDLPENESAIDYRAVRSMLRAAWTEEQVRDGMLRGARDLVGRHPGTEDYLDRTIKAAQIDLGLRAPDDEDPQDQAAPVERPPGG